MSRQLSRFHEELIEITYGRPRKSFLDICQEDRLNDRRRSPRLREQPRNPILIEDDTSVYCAHSVPRGETCFHCGVVGGKRKSKRSRPQDLDDESIIFVTEPAAPTREPTPPPQQLDAEEPEDEEEPAEILPMPRPSQPLPVPHWVSQYDLSDDLDPLCALFEASYKPENVWLNDQFDRVIATLALYQNSHSRYSGL